MKGTLKALDLLKKRIVEDGRVIGDDILKVDMFLNHQIDVVAVHALPGICRGEAALHDPPFHFQIFGNIGKDVGVVINNQNFDGHRKVPSSGFVAGSLETSRFFHADISPLLALHHGL